MIAGIPYESWITVPEHGDEIVAVGEHNQIVGKTIFNGGFTAMTIYGDDQYTTNVVENLSNGESFTFEVWNESFKSTKKYNFERWAQGDNHFSNKQISIVGIEETIIAENEFSIDIYPNPGTGWFMLNVYANEAMAVQITCHDNIGKQVFNDNLILAEGKQNFELDLSYLANGTYILKLFNKEVDKQTSFIISK